MYLVAEVRLFKAVPIHHVTQVFKDAVKHLMELFPYHGQWLLRWKHSSEEFHLQMVTKIGRKGQIKGKIGPLTLLSQHVNI